MVDFLKKIYNTIYKRDAVRTSVDGNQAISNNWNKIRDLVGRKV